MPRTKTFKGSFLLARKQRLCVYRGELQFVFFFRRHQNHNGTCKLTLRECAPLLRHVPLLALWSPRLLSGTLQNLQVNTSRTCFLSSACSVACLLVAASSYWDPADYHFANVLLSFGTFHRLQLSCHGFDSRRVCARAHCWKTYRSSVVLRDTPSRRVRAYFCSSVRRPYASREPADDWDYFFC
jgi:hypothetical protein